MSVHCLVFVSRPCVYTPKTATGHAFRADDGALLSAKSDERCMANPALGAVLEFLFSANLESTDAFATAKTFLEAGVNSKEAILALTPERVKELAPKKAHRKLLGALRRAAEPSAPSAGSSGASAKQARRAADEPDPTPPLAPDAFDEGLVVLVNRSPVMVLWAACLAHLDGYTWAEALSLGSAVAAQMARAKGSSLGLYSTAPPQHTQAAA